MSADWIVPDWPAPPSVRALATTRGGAEGGEGLGFDDPYGNFNLATHVGDDPQTVAANRQRLRFGARLPDEPLWLNQVHGIRVLRAEYYRQGMQPDADDGADACVARTPGPVCTVLTADCLPLLLCDAQGTVVAAAHAGWRGLAAGVIESTVAAMQIAPARLLAWLGPAIGASAFEVGDEVRAVFCRHDAQAASAFVAHAQGKWLCDLYLLARQRLAALGVSQVCGGEWCTFSDPRRFYSYRRDGATGRMATLIWLDHDG